MAGIRDLPFPKRHNQSVKIPLATDLTLEQWFVPSGTVVSLLVTANFGWVALPEGTRDKRGFVIPKRIFKY